MANIYGRRKAPLYNKLLRFRTIDPITNCWLWNGLLVKGYGMIEIPWKGGRLTTGVHRVAKHIWEGFDLDSNLNVNHKCKNKSCFNPEHTYIGTQSDNMSDRGE